MTGRGGAPTADPAASAGVQWPLVGGVVGLLLVSNVIVNRLLPSAAYVPWNLTVAAALLWLARSAGLRWSDLGWHRPTLARSLRWGAIGVAVVGGLYLIAVALPATRTLFEDSRASDRDIVDLIYHVGVQIPLGTVLLEEIAFRGVLPAAFGLRGVGSWQWRPVLAASVLFGLWHVLPSLELDSTNEGVVDALGRNSALTVLLAVIGTTVAGVVLCRVRWLGRGILAPVLVHLATNTLGFSIAWALTG